MRKCRTVTPSRGSKERITPSVPPYRVPTQATTSPALSKPSKLALMAAMPLANPTAVSPPSSAAILRSKAATVGLANRL